MPSPEALEEWEQVCLSGRRTHVWHLVGMVCAVTLMGWVIAASERPRHLWSPLVLASGAEGLFEAAFAVGVVAVVVAAAVAIAAVVRVARVRRAAGRVRGWLDLHQGAAEAVWLVPFELTGDQEVDRILVWYWLLGGVEFLIRGENPYEAGEAARRAIRRCLADRQEGDLPRLARVVLARGAGTPCC